MSNWNKEETKQLIQLYRNYPCLYHPNDKSYRDKDARENKFIELFEQMVKIKSNLTMLSLKKKIKTLADQMSREFTKVKQSQQTGRSYKPKLWCYEELSFINVTDDSGREPSVTIDEDTNGSFEPHEVVNSTSHEDENYNQREPSSSNSTHKTKEDLFGELIALELKEFKFSGTYQCFAKTVLDFTHYIKNRETILSAAGIATIDRSTLLPGQFFTRLNDLETRRIEKSGPEIRMKLENTK